MTEHAPRYRFDCDRCKFSWCCGYTCACALKKKPDPPPDIQQAVNKSRTEKGLTPEFTTNQ